MVRGDFLSIVNTDVPMTSERCRRILGELSRLCPQCRGLELTQSFYGRPVSALEIGTGPRKVIFSAAHHGNEWLTATVLLKFAEDLIRAIGENSTIWGVPAKTITEYSTLCLIPMVNPDGVDLVTGAIGPGDPGYDNAVTLSENYPSIPFPSGWKANLLGVDLNLQYPAGWLQAREIKFSQGYTRPGPRDYVGRAPLNQKESFALADYTAETDPRLVLALHSQGNVIYWKFRDYQVPGAKELAEEFARVSGYALEETPYASSFAGYKDWFIQEYRRPGFTIEVGTGENPLPTEQFDEIYKNVLGILVTAATGLPGGV